MTTWNGIERLTAREREVVAALIRGWSNKQIAAELGISAETVKRHLATIYDKLGISGRLAVVLHIMQSGPPSASTEYSKKAS